MDEELYIKRKIKYVKFEYDIFIKQTKLAYSVLLMHLLGGIRRVKKYILSK